ncbi:L,D-transpeptidase family protein [Sphingomonas colocasiae]|uniref:L,D-transpeptidase family protein n=1 Tax=Sphingomonas colocasiae TaxID=1848973 RepID=A0ABS7PMQ5_9SPHN|nr:L,D-transpeptidase family protein [Sphingomonas colocasiae]MBY8821732.1 L,D-transpeptidase family protein [Sphingomonas colocasiae]
MARVPFSRSALAAVSLMLTAWLCALPAMGGAQPIDAGARLHRAAASLQPGEFLWNAAIPDDSPLTIGISIALQRIYVYRGDTLIGVSSISTGKPGKETPLGDFRILQKAKWHRSNLYSNAPMPFMQRLTWDGIALHAGWNPGYPASHGCIRLPFAFARALFDMTTLGSMVSVTDYPLRPPVYLRFAELEWAAMDEIVTQDDGRVIGNHGRVQPLRRPWRAGAGGDRIAAIRLEYSSAVFAYE